MGFTVLEDGAVLMKSIKKTARLRNKLSLFSSLLSNVKKAPVHVLFMVANKLMPSGNPDLHAYFLLVVISIFYFKRKILKSMWPMRAVASTA